MKINFICLLFVLGLTMACEDEPVETDCQRTISTIHEFIDTYKLKTVDLHVDGHLWLDQSFTLEDSFINISGTRYNLCFLKQYNRDNNSVGLYF
jgi:hypothetical protein